MSAKAELILEPGPHLHAKETTARIMWWVNASLLPVVVWGAVLPDITYRNKYPEIHRVNGTMINQNEVAAKFMTGLGYKRYAVIHDTTDYGKGHNKYFSQFLAKNGGQIVGTFGVTADQQDFTAELTKVKELKPEVVYFGGLTPIGIRIKSQMDKLGIKAVFEGTSGIKSAAYHDGLGKDLADVRLDEAAVLAAAIHAPNRTFFGHSARAIQARRDWILQAMRGLDTAAESAVREAMARPLPRRAPRSADQPAHSKRGARGARVRS